MRWIFAAVVLFAVVLPLTGQDPTPPPVEPVTVILLRHAETTESTSRVRDPELSEKGLARAKALANMLAPAGVSHLYASEFKRTQATLAPLAKLLGKTVEVIPAANPEPQVKALRDLPPGSVAVLCGHSNTVPRLAEMLGGQIKGLVNTPPYGDIIQGNRYDRVFLMTLPGVGSRSQVKLVEINFPR